MRGTETGHCHDISGSPSPSANGSLLSSNLHPPPTTMILGAIVEFGYMYEYERENGKREMGMINSEVEGKSEARGMWMGFVRPIGDFPHKRESPPWDREDRGTTEALHREQNPPIPHWGKRGWGSEWVCRFLSADHVTVPDAERQGQD